MVDRLRKEGIRDEVVLGVMASIPRHIFVDASGRIAPMKMVRCR